MQTITPYRQIDTRKHVDVAAHGVHLSIFARGFLTKM